MLAVAAPACYATDNGTAPPPDKLYFPVGMAVSRGGSVLYVANSDFDLQYTGGTIQSYDLRLIRRHALLAIEDPADPNLPLAFPLAPGAARGGCPGNPPGTRPGTGTRQPLGETCSPPVDSTRYVRRAVTIGAFASDLQLLRSERTPLSSLERFAPEQQGAATGTRLFAPVRGDASLTWIDIKPDDPLIAPPEDPAAPYEPFELSCGATALGGRCGERNRAGRVTDPGNKRRLSMPGEPFGMAFSQDGTQVVVTHQTEGKASLFSTGFDALGGRVGDPSLQFVLTGISVGGNGVATIPHDRALACVPGESCASEPPRPAFLETSRAVPGVDLLRFFSDEGAVPASNLRPFLVREGTIPIATNNGGNDSRGIAIDRTPRLRCKARLRANPPASPVELATRMEACAKLPARLFIANRSPSTLLIGEIGADDKGTYNPDRVTLFRNEPLTFGPSRVFLAPIVDADGRYALRVFVVCFDSAQLFVYDPDAERMEAVVRVGSGPFSMAFDPFDWEDVAAGKRVEPDPREPGRGLLRYRFGYLASFTTSFIQVLDLDNSRARKDTFEKVVFTLGVPTLPKGTQ